MILLDISISWQVAVCNCMILQGNLNRWRVNKYREFAESAGLRIKSLTPTGHLDSTKVEIIYPEIAKEFREISPCELSWLGFRINMEHTWLAQNPVLFESLP